jgi:hypothetical protein
VSIEHRENYIIDASCAAEAQYVAADFAVHRGDSQYAGQVLEHADETLNYICAQLEACQHTGGIDHDQIDA